MPVGRYCQVKGRWGEMSDIKISIIVPIYNVENYLRRCIESIVTQSYRNIEIILVNDGSTDKCAGICDEFLKKMIE